ncbi:MAG TPA: CBS domain-containing protein [Chloroflexi bacterium]|nr:CBS domain-containing protein [Chloroflexota bacterium]
MQLQGEAIRVTIYIGESDRYQGANLYMAILEFLRSEGASGATITRAIAGFGARSRIHTGAIEVLSSDLPIRIEWIDLPPRVARLLPQLQQMVDDGLIVQEPVTVVQYSMGRSKDPLAQPVAHVMREEITTVPLTAPVAEVVTLLLERGLRSIPVVDAADRLVGIITDGDLLQRAGLMTRLGIQKDLPADQVHGLLAALRQSSLTAGEIMTTPVISVHNDEPVRTAVTRMVKHNLKRLPVINEDGKLMGMVSRIDIFRTVAFHQGGVVSGEDAPRLGRTVTELMYTDAPTVGPEASLEEIVRALEASKRRRVIVVDEARHVLGIITDGDLLRRSQQKHLPGLTARLRSLLVGEPAVAQVLPDAGERAVDLMTTPVITIRPDAPLTEALQLMTTHAVKRLPVVDEQGRLIGLLGRASVLRGLLENR